MKGIDWLQLLIYLAILTAITKPLGNYIYNVLSPKRKTPLDRVLKPVEELTYRVCGIDAKKEQTWQQYLGALLIFSVVILVFTYVVLALQHHLPLNPAKFKKIGSALNFNTSASFLTNTNWQNYGGESTMSYFSQMVGLTFQNFISPAVGLAVLAALSRGIARFSSKTIGNFWVDIVRITYYLFLPFAIIIAVFFVSQGTPQNFNSYVSAANIEGATQTIIQGPIASQEAIKMMGTNGGGFTNANSAHPFENPTPFSNFIQILLLLAIPAAQVYYFGREVKHQKHGWCLYIVMAILFTTGTIVCTHYEAKGNPNITSLGVEQRCGNMEGKEQRFGNFGSTLFATATTSASNGSVNSMHDSYTPIGGMIPMLNLQFSEIIFGGVGSGLYGMIVFVIIAVFTAGLIIGRIPEYIGKKIQALDMKLVMIALLVSIVCILSFTGWASYAKWGTSALGNNGPHGFSEILYAFSSTLGNNGSAFAGLSATTTIWNILLGIAMLIGRFSVIIPIIALAGSLANKRLTPEGPASFPVTGTTFTLLLIGVIILVGSLSFLPALVMGPLFEQFFMNAAKLF